MDTEQVEDLTEKEMEVMMTVFRSFETGLREATIYPKVEGVLAMKHKTQTNVIWVIIHLMLLKIYCFAS